MNGFQVPISYVKILTSIHELNCINPGAHIPCSAKYIEHDESEHGQDGDALVQHRGGVLQHESGRRRRRLHRRLVVAPLLLRVVQPEARAPSVLLVGTHAQ